MMIAGCEHKFNPNSSVQVWNGLVLKKTQTNPKNNNRKKPVSMKPEEIPGSVLKARGKPAVMMHAANTETCLFWKSRRSPFFVLVAMLWGFWS